MRDRRHRVTRREFLTATAALSAASLLPVKFPLEASQVEAMPTKVLGRTGERVSVLGFGGTANVTPPLLNIALAEGVTYLDTAQSYGNGNSERNIGSLLEKNGRRKECFIVTKSTNHSASGLVANLEQGSLPRLRTDYVDLYYLHNLGDPGRLDDEMMRTAERLKKEKKIRFFGFSSHHNNMVPTMNKAAEVGFVDVIMILRRRLTQSGTRQMRRGRHRLGSHEDPRWRHLLPESCRPL